MIAWTQHEFIGSIFQLNKRDASCSVAWSTWVHMRHRGALADNYDGNTPSPSTEHVGGGETRGGGGDSGRESENILEILSLGRRCNNMRCAGLDRGHGSPWRRAAPAAAARRALAWTQTAGSAGHALSGTVGWRCSPHRSCGPHMPVSSVTLMYGGARSGQWQLFKISNENVTL